MKKIDFGTSYLYTGTVVSQDLLFLLLRRDYEAQNAHCVGLITDGSSLLEIRMDDDFYVGVVAYKDYVHVLGQNGNTIRFHVPSNPTAAIVVESRTQLRIDDVDDFLELTKIRLINGTVYCCGQFGQLYSRGLSSWDRADKGYRSMNSRDFEDIGGLSDDELYGVGLAGEITWFDGTKWREVTVPTNQNINVIERQGETLIAAGYHGLVLRGRQNAWEILGEPSHDRHYWDVAVDGRLCYLLYDNGIDVIEGNIVRETGIKTEFSSKARRFAAGGGQIWIVCEDSVYQLDDRVLRKKEVP